MAAISPNGARVKLYSFGESHNWDEMGTGHVTVQYLDRLQGLSLIVRSEDDGSVLLESKIVSDRTYQKREEALILWTEDDSCDLALSFQENACCNEVWGRICDFQGKNPAIDTTQPWDDDGDVTKSMDDGDITKTLDDSLEEQILLPQCELGKLEELFETITQVMSQPLRMRANLALSLEKEGYIQKLLELFRICEDLENMDGLHHLYNIFRTLFLLNKPFLLSFMLQPDLIMDVIGCLEYNPSKPHPVKHRQYLQNTSRHRDVLSLNNSELLDKIHLTYKIIYIQEVILPTPSLFEENMMSALNSIILFNKTEIVNTIQKDRKLLYNLLSQLSRDSLHPIEKYKELCLFLRELCHFAQALEVEDGTKFYQELCKLDLIPALIQMLTSEVEDVVTIAVDILNLICDFNSSIIREHILKQTNVDEDGQFLNIIIGLLVDVQFSSIDVQLVGLIKTIIDPEIIMTEANTAVCDYWDNSAEKTVFLNYFYKHCMHMLMAPLMAQSTGDKISKDTVQNATLLGHVLDILSLGVERHSCHIRNYIIEKNILGRVLVLMTSSHGHLALSALRFCRKIIGLKNEFYNRYIVRNNLFAPIVKAFMASGHRYNLINSAVIELFEYIKTENIKILINYIVEKFMSAVESVQYTDTFQALKLKYDQERDRVASMQLLQQQANDSSSSLSGIIHEFTTSRFRRDPRDLDEDEESWFDDEEESTSYNNSSTKLPPPPPPATPPATPPPASLASNPFFIQSGSNSHGYSPRPPMAAAYSRPSLSFSAAPRPSMSLVDYDEDSDEDQVSSPEDEANESPPTSSSKRIKLDTNAQL